MKKYLKQFARYMLLCNPITIAFSTLKSIYEIK